MNTRFQVRSILAPFRTAWLHRDLIVSLTLHGIGSRYRTSWLGLLWPVLLPVLLIGVFSFVFAFVMPLKWIGDGGGRVSFPLFLYTGLVVFTFFSEVVNRAPGLVLENANLVKKVVFPLEILTLISVFTALIFFCINLLVLTLFILLAGIDPGWKPLLLIHLVVPFTLFLTGLSWFLAGLTVYVRDVVQVIGVVVSALMFLSPVFYPLESAPDPVAPYLAVNPLAILIESLRTVMFTSGVPNLTDGLLMWGVGLATFYLGYMWFGRLKEGFSDVL